MEMNNNNERVLAYTKAHELTQEELLKVSGGAGQSAKTTRTGTFKVTGFIQAGRDMDGDFEMDW